MYSQIEVNERGLRRTSCLKIRPGGVKVKLIIIRPENARNPAEIDDSNLHSAVLSEFIRNEVIQWDQDSKLSMPDRRRKQYQ